MKAVRQLFLGLITAVASSLLVLGAASLALVEGNLAALPTLTTPQPDTVVTPAPGLTIEPAEPALPTATQPQPTSCPTPEGWSVYIVQVGDTLEALAEASGVSVETLSENNCLSSATLLPGAILWLPAVAPTNTPVPALPTVEPTHTAEPTSTVTLTSVPCGPPQGWVPYIVRPGDTLFRLSMAVRVSVQQLMFANCLTSDRIRAGERLFLPFIPPVVPTATRIPNTPTPSDTPRPSDTPEPEASPTNTVAPSETPVPSSTPTDTPTPTSTDTNTPVPTNTVTNTVAPTNTPVETTTDSTEANQSEETQTSETEP